MAKTLLNVISALTVRDRRTSAAGYRAAGHPDQELHSVRPRKPSNGVSAALLSALAPAIVFPLLALPSSPASAQAATASAPLATFTETLPGSVVKVNMVAIPAGSVTIRGQKVPVKPFYIASTETPWEAFDAFIASGPPSPPYDQTEFAADAVARPSKSYILPDLGWGHHGYPAINISFTSATMYCRWLSQKTGKKYRLPTEAEWEYACRAGAAAPSSLTPAQLDKVAWYGANSDKVAHPVGKKLPNAWKLYDMLGNVGEWATDLTGKPILCGPTFKDAAAQMTCAERKRQTPKWQETDPQLPKSRWWLSDGPFCGFRVICEP